MTLLTLDIAGRRYRADTAAARSLAIRLDFGGPQPNFFAAPAAGAESYAAGEFVGDTRAGGSCNVGVYRLNPHCNGTHTECIGHVVDDAVAIADLTLPAFMPATLVTVDATPGGAIVRDTLADVLSRWPDAAFRRALILRTRPNDTGKTRRRYEADAPPAYLDHATVRLIRETGAEHLLVDLPSLDAMDDDALTAHRIFWGLPPGSRTLGDAERPQATVTEMIYAADEIADGYYLLNLQLPAFATDAAPSRPLIFPV